MASNSSSSKGTAATPAAARMVPTRSTSSSRSMPTTNQQHLPVAQPTVPHHESNAFAVVDSADPFIGDMIYRLDDNRAEQQHQYQDDRVAAVQGQPRDEVTGEPVAAESATAESLPQPPPPSTEETSDHLEWYAGLPVWKRPSIWWLVPLVSILAIGSGATMSSKVELFTQIVCEELLSTETTAPGYTPQGSFLRLPLERPPMSSACRTNPDVIAGSATLQLKVTMSMGLLSALTTGFWGGLSDRRGRTKVLAIAVFGVLMMDASFLAVGLLPVSSLPGGTHFLLFASAAEGMLGGLATIIAAHQAYISDCTPSGTRARIYTQLAGFFYCGFVIGPALGGWMVRALDSLMSTFLLAGATHLLYFLLILFAVPESTNPERRKAAMREHQKAVSGGEGSIRLPDDGVDEQQGARSNSNDGSLTRGPRESLLLRLLTPLRPLAMLLPRQVDEVERLQSRPATPMPSLSRLRATASAQAHEPAPSASASHISVSHISRARKRDWNLTLLSLAYGLEMSCMGILAVKALYAQEVFDWGASELGYFMTVTALARVLCLTIIIPVGIRVWHRPPKGVALPQDSGNDGGDAGGYLDDEGRALDDDEDEDEEDAMHASSGPATVEELWTMRAKQLRMLHDSHFDLKLARVSVCVSIGAYLLMSLVHGPVPFVVGTLLTSLSGGGGASMSSLALAILQEPNQAGKLFGAWSILSAIFSTLVGPLFFTWVFRATVHTAPATFFWAGLAVLCSAAACLAAVRVRKTKSLPGLPPRPKAAKHAAARGQQRQQTPRRSVFADEEENESAQSTAPTTPNPQSSTSTDSKSSRGGRR